MTDEESRNEKLKGANARSVKAFCLHLLIIWSFDFYKEQWGYSSGSTAPKVTPEWCQPWSADLGCKKGGVEEIVHRSSERGSADEQVKALWYRILYHQWGLTWVQKRALLVRSVVCVPKRKTKRKKKKNTQNIVPTTDNRHYCFTFRKIWVLGVSNWTFQSFKS